MIQIVISFVVHRDNRVRKTSKSNTRHKITVNSSRNVLPDISPTDCCGESPNTDCPAQLDSSSTVQTAGAGQVIVVAG